MGKVLLIDDSPMMRTYLRRCLEKGGFTVEDWVPLSAMEIAPKVTESTPDIILTDYQMPGCNGGTVARMAQKADPKIPVIVLTAFRDAELIANLQKFGVREVLAKPITPETLLAAVNAALGNDYRA